MPGDRFTRVIERIKDERAGRSKGSEEHMTLALPNDFINWRLISDEIEMLARKISLASFAFLQQLLKSPVRDMPGGAICKQVVIIAGVHFEQV